MDDLYCKKLFLNENGSEKTMNSINALLKKNEELKEYINNRYSDSTSNKETVYRIIHDIENRPLCYCGKQVSFSSKNHFNKYCSSKCQNSDPEKIAKDKKSKLEKYGDENYNNIEKNRKTCFEKYGSDCFAKTEIFIKKVKETNLKKYGSEWWLQTDSCKRKSKETKKEKYGDENYNNRNKAKKTSLERYGVENTKQWEGAKLKEKETCLKKYGVTSYTKTNEYKQKSKETSIKHFGADNCTKSSLWKEKWYGNKEWSEKRNDNIYNSMIKNGSFHNSKPESIILNFLRENYPDVINQYKDERYPFKCDYYIPSKDLFIEYNGYWTHGGHFFDETNPEDVNQLKMWENSDKKQYKNAIQTWTVRDINKLKKAKENKLNFIVLWYDDFKDLNKIKEMVDRF